MREPVDLGAAPSGAVLDGALGLALAAGAPLRLQAPLAGADLEVALAAVRLAGDPGAADAAREALTRAGGAELALPHPRAGLHRLQFSEPGAAARALSALSWPLALLGKPSELRLRGPNHSEGTPTFHDLRLGWAAFAARFGLKLSLELTEAGFADEAGELVASLDPAPALTPLHAMHRGLLRQVSVVAAVAGGQHEPALEAAQQVGRALRRQGVIAEAERVPLPMAASAEGRSRWAVTAVADFEHSHVTVSELGRWGADAHEVGERVARRLGEFLQRRGALDAPMAERLLLPSFLCAAGLGARAGTPPGCHYTTSEVTSSLLELATLARRALPVKAVVDGAQGEEGVVVVTPAG
ncbi:MAG TPA: RNA 3'-terminal phosphate cyclase [Myxococcales bacterium]|nr:RNA 3'-terminal phosphate cyclase [Myxococcales bacterium]